MISRAAKSRMLSSTVDAIDLNLQSVTGHKHVVLLITHDEKIAEVHLHGNVDRDTTIALLESALEMARGVTNNTDKSLN